MKKSRLLWLGAVAVFVVLSACSGGGSGVSVDGDTDGDWDGDIPSDGDESVGCWTPCLAGAVIDGIYVPCSDEGLMPGCLGRSVCRDGWCVTEDEDPSSGEEPSDRKNRMPKDKWKQGLCEEDCDCPEHGSCVEGRCKGQCATDSGCAEGEVCYKKVCRRACGGKGMVCSTGTYCLTGEDGVSGHCMPLCEDLDEDIGDNGCLLSANDTGNPPFELSGDELAEGILSFTVGRTEAAFTLVNHTQCDLGFRLSKKQHTAYGPDGATVVTNEPLAWVGIKVGEGEVSADSEVEISLGPGESVEVRVQDAHNETIPNWQGVLDLLNTDGLGRTEVDLSFSSGATGRWQGRMFFFANFGSDNLNDWIADKDNSTKLNSVNNAFLKRWDVLRRGEITMDNFMALIASTLNGSWQWSSVKQACPKSNGACYPYANPAEGGADNGIENYSDDLARDPIPTGLIELPVVMNLERREDEPRELVGRIISGDTLHYAGEPEVRLTTESDADDCSPVGEFSVCINRVEDMTLDVVVGGRYYADPGQTNCDEADGFDVVRTPWLLADFLGGTELVDGQRYRPECRDTYRPYTETPLDAGAVSLEDLNATLAGSNPLPDGRSLERSLMLVDGAVIDRDTMVLIFREEFFVDLDTLPEPEDFSAYGFMLLRRTPDPVEAADYQGSQQTEDRSMPEGVLEVACSENILERAGFGAMPSDDADLRSLASIMIEGYDVSAPLTELTRPVHYLCWETGLFDTGETGGMPCPLGSPVTFFYFPDPADEVDLTRHECQNSADFIITIDPDTLAPEVIVTARGECETVFKQWDSPNGPILVEPYWLCEAGEDICDDARDRRAGKTFYDLSVEPDREVLPGLDTATNEAFRYKAAFRNRRGKNIGFAPEICIPGSTAIPYCYAPWQIEENQERVDCALALYLDHYNTPGDATADLLRAYLSRNFSSRCVDDGMSPEDCSRPENRIDGFEALNGELLVMLGDESYTRAFASRFDLAGVGKAAFKGSLFEPGGINLSGVAGYEMYSLYQATQYYQLALDRFYRLLPAIAESVAKGDGAIISAETVTSYLDRLIRASTQKSRTWSEVATRYQGFNRPDLARRVVRRAYTATYLESALITRVMHNIIDAVPPEDEAQILFIIEQAQLRYMAALLAMRDVNKAIIDDVNYFGFTPDYIPFPAMDAGDTNAFEKLIASAWAKTQFAAEKEEKALSSNRDYETDSASFQAELVKIRNSYETQLFELCGTFTGTDGATYPAIVEYASLHPKARMLADPCGLVGNGAIFEELMGIQDATLELSEKMLARSNIIEQIQIEIERRNLVCETIDELKDFTLAMADTKIGLQAAIDTADIIVNAVKRAESTVANIADLSKCSVGTSTDCPTAAWSISMVAGTSIAANIALASVEAGKALAAKGIMVAEKEAVRMEMESQCTLAQIDSNAVIRNLALDMLTADVEIQKAAVGLQLAYGQLEKQVNTAILTRAEYEEVLQQTINVEAARNDPNMRIYKNDAVINADRAFQVALKEAYKATKLFEYYTSQSYAHLVDLFLVRMVSAGDYNLENYLMELDGAFYDFEEEFGNPDLRLAIVSMRDDVFRIPLYDANNSGVALPQSERNRMFVERLLEGARYGESGYLISFNTQLDHISPLTRNHKINYVEAEILGDNLGDELGRIYLVQRGTGTVHAVTGDKIYYRFPPRAAVMNTFFNGERSIVVDIDYNNVYANKNLRDRPLINTEWQLIFDPLGELVNQDIDISGISDIRLHLYYNDFTSL